jgi:hypothetical protein
LARIERPDRHLRHRAKVVSELRLLTRLLDAVHAAEPPLITRRAAELRALDERTANEPDLVVTEPGAPRTPAAAASAALATDASPELRDDDTQLLKTGTAADPTAVIPAEELDRLRAESAAGPNEDTESWYEVLEPFPPVDEAGSAEGSESSEDLVLGDAVATEDSLDGEVEPEPIGDGADEADGADALAEPVSAAESAQSEVTEVLELPEPDQESQPKAAAEPESEAEPESGGGPESEPETEAEPESELSAEANPPADTELPADDKPPVTRPVRQRKAAARPRTTRRRR